MNSLFAILLLILLFIYEKIWRPIVCKKKIYSHISNLGGEVGTIEKLTPRDEIYIVYYYLNGESKDLHVKFNFFYKTTWQSSS